VESAADDQSRRETATVSVRGATDLELHILSLLTDWEVLPVHHTYQSSVTCNRPIALEREGRERLTKAQLVGTGIVRARLTFISDHSSSGY
jgi:hypothetical protein